MTRSPAAAPQARSSSDPEGLRCRRCALSEPRSPSLLAGNPSVGAAGRRRGLPCTTGLLGPLKATTLASQPWRMEEMVTLLEAVPQEREALTIGEVMANPGALSIL